MISLKQLEKKVRYVVYICLLITRDFIQKGDDLDIKKTRKNIVQVYIIINVIKNRQIYYKYGLFYCQSKQKNTL